MKINAPAIERTVNLKGVSLKKLILGLLLPHTRSLSNMIGLEF
jgi:hypothetical protein